MSSAQYSMHLKKVCPQCSAVVSVKKLITTSKNSIVYHDVITAHMQSQCCYLKMHACLQYSSVYYSVIQLIAIILPCTNFDLLPPLYIF